MYLAILNLGAGEWLVILLVFVMLFGASKIPDIAKALGRAKGDFERAKRDAEAELRKETAEAGKPAPAGAEASVNGGVEAKVRKAA